MDEFRVIEQLKAELERLHEGPPEQSYRDIAVKVEMDHGNLQRFLNGERGISLATFGRICKKLNLELTPIRKTKGSR